jgi:hypothetical protein
VGESAYRCATPATRWCPPGELQRQGGAGELHARHHGGGGRHRASHGVRGGAHRLGAALHRALQVVQNQPPFLLAKQPPAVAPGAAHDLAGRQGGGGARCAGRVPAAATPLDPGAVHHAAHSGWHERLDLGPYMAAGASSSAPPPPPGGACRGVGARSSAHAHAQRRCCSPLEALSSAEAAASPTPAIPRRVPRCTLEAWRHCAYPSRAAVHRGVRGGSRGQGWRLPAATPRDTIVSVWPSHSSRQQTRRARRLSAMGSRQVGPAAAASPK